MAVKREEAFSSEGPREPKMIRLTINRRKVFSLMLRNLHSIFSNWPNFKVTLGADDSELLMESCKPSFLLYLSPNFKHRDATTVFSKQSVTSSLKISSLTKNDKEFIVFEKHSLEIFQSSVTSSIYTNISLDKTQSSFKYLHELVGNILRSWTAQFDLLDKFFAAFATWIGALGIFQTIRGGEDKVKLELWKMTSRVLHVSITVFSEDWNERPKLVMDVQAGRSYRNLTVRTPATIQPVLNLLKSLLQQDEKLFMPSTLALPTSPGISISSIKVVFSSPSGSTSSSVAPVQPMLVKDGHVYAMRKGGPRKKSEEYKSSFIHAMRIFADNWDALEMRPVAENQVIFFQNQEISLAKYEHLKLPLGFKDASLVCKLTVEDKTEGSVYLVNESLCHEELLPESWEYSDYFNSNCGIGKLIISWELQINLLKQFLEELDWFLGSFCLSMEVFPEQNELRLEINNGPHFELKCHWLAGWKMRPFLQIVKSEENRDVEVFRCRIKVDIQSMILKCFPRPESMKRALNGTVETPDISAEKLFSHLERILQGSGDMTPVSIKKFHQKFGELKVMLAVMQKKQHISLDVEKEKVTIQTHSGSYNLNINFVFVQCHTHVSCRMEMNGPGQFSSHRYFFLRDLKHYVGNLASCLSDFSLKAQVLYERDGHIVVEVMEEEEKVKKEEPGASESDYWLRLENLKEETDS